MKASEEQSLSLAFDRFQIAISAVTVAIGLLALLGWLLDLNLLKSGLPGLTFMKANTALGIILSGLALLRIQIGSQSLVNLSSVLASLVMLLGVLTCLEYLTGLNLHLDQLLIKDTSAFPGEPPGRMSFNSALCLFALGLALLLLNHGKNALAIHALAMVPLLGGGAALIGYAFDFDAFGIATLNYKPMALNSAMAFVFLAQGIITARPDYPFRRLMTSSSAAGYIVRRLLPAAIGFTLITGWLVHRGFHAGYFSQAFTLPLFASASIAAVCAIILWNARLLHDTGVQHKQREKQRLGASQYARSLIEASLDPLVTISAAGKITDVNEATVKATGVVREAIIGRDFSEFFTEPDKARAGYLQVFAKGYVTDYPLTLRNVSGKLIDVLYNASVYRDENGEVAGVFAVARDISELKKTEERNRYLATIVDSLDDAIIGKTLDGIITSWNKGAERMYGYAASEIVGQPTSILIPPERTNEYIGILETIRSGRHVLHFETTRRTKQGTIIFVSLTISPITEADGNIVGAATVARDITQRKQAEQEVAKLSLRNQLILDSAGEGIYGLDKEGRCTFANPAASQILGFTVDELIGQHSHDKFHHSKPDGNPYPEAECPVLAAYTQGTLHRGRDIYWRKDGSSFPVEFISTPIIEAEKISGAVVAFRDITETKQAEEELRKYHEQLEELVRERTSALETANKDLEGFAYSVSHDLRVPLRAIDGFSQQVLKRYQDQLDDEGKRYLNIVRDNTKKMGQLIDDILAFSRMGRLGMTIAEIDMAELARSVLEEFKLSLAGRELALRIDALPACKGDQAMLRQVWINLIGNAIKFTKHKPEAVIEVGGHVEGQENIYFVKDNGAGFDMQYAEKLFGVFQRLHGVEEFEGTGIGLAIVKRIIVRHGGRVWAEGEVNQGATLYFALPI